MGEKIKKILRGQIPTSVFYIAFGLCLALMPVETVDILCKVIFGLLLMGAGLYHVYVYVMEKENSTILDLFSGVIVLVIGGFLFTNPQIVVKLLPLMLGAFLLVDSIWALRGCPGLRKRQLEAWKFFLVESLAFIVVGVFLMLYPFQSVNNMLVIAGWAFLVNGVLDIILFIVLKSGMKKEIPGALEEEKEELKEEPKKKEEEQEEIPQWQDGAAKEKERDEKPAEEKEPLSPELSEEKTSSEAGAQEEASQTEGKAETP
ncbi:MAG: DUF308 domain-containing protein [Eubacteriales bacterium]|nr:DUF308 domain-containing protein [Eubacteriales bacterium]